ncbi:hypothetical protein [Amycolatopsis sp. H20-H5]|uniref:hypothetical protein n=1 Tax=Amycolatopsis sp. H20-H5 TaxID=3046309 RepID=UPI002DB6B0C5|nr:hypothetical protein [Amycolatopsis sp. H20-H5]MEC3976155.1 hypothetical protein [Amycolatopsis sp. H20-H5]
MTGAGFTVDPAVLETYATGLEERGGRVKGAADKVSTVNGGDINAFGVAVGQVLGIPTRIALGVLHDQVASAAKAFTDQTANVRAAAAKYRDTEGDHTAAFSGEQP